MCIDFFWLFLNFLTYINYYLKYYVYVMYDVVTKNAYDYSKPYYYFNEIENLYKFDILRMCTLWIIGLCYVNTLICNVDFVVWFILISYRLSSIQDL